MFVFLFCVCGGVGSYSLGFYLDRTSDRLKQSQKLDMLGIATGTYLVNFNNNKNLIKYVNNLLILS